MNIGVVVLAAGESKRMGMIKQILPVYEVAMLKHVVNELLKTQFHPITVVLGANKEKVVPVLKDMPIGIIDNPDWKNGGLGSSIRMGLVGSYLLTKGFDALIFVAADMPTVTAEALYELVNISTNNTDKSFVYYKKNEFPFLVKSELFESLLDLNDDKPFEVLNKASNTLVLDTLFTDINTPEDYLKFLENQN